MENNKHQEFLRRYEPIHLPFIRYCSTKAIGFMETEDLAQEAVLGTLLNYEAIENKEKLLAYMIGVVNNLVYKHLRRAKFRGTWDERVLEKLEGRTGNPEVALDLQYLLKAIKQLPSAQGQSIELFELCGLSIKEIAAIQMVSVGAVKTRISRGRKQLKKMLEEEGNTMSLAQRLAIYVSILF